MAEQTLKYLEQAGGAISLFAVAVIIIGFILASGRYAYRCRKLTLKENFGVFKTQLGHSLMLGIEILVLADVIETITVPPTFQSLTVLAFLILVRTALSWTLTLETEGHWPWQGSTEEKGND